MRLALSFATSSILVLAAVWLAPPAAADTVPVPDVRGMREAQAQRALAQAGLRLGGVERVSAEQLASELGRRYEPGIVVQQAPPPSVGDTPSWQPRGAAVWLRVSVGAAARVVPTVPTQPAIPVVPYVPTQPAIPVVPYVPTQPTTAARTPGSPPPPPPPPYRGPQPAPTVPYVTTTPGPVYPTPAPGPTTIVPPAPIDTTLIGAVVPSRVRLACERGREKWHVRGLGGAAFHFGEDSASTGGYGGADLGYTFDGCVGVDFFYRYDGGRFDRTMPTGILEDGGDTHHIGLKVTFEGSFDRTSRFYYWMGIGPEYFWTARLTSNDDGFGGYGELGIGYLISDDVRVRFGVTAHGFESSAGRELAINDNNSRFLWTVAPTLGLQIDF